MRNAQTGQFVTFTGEKRKPVAIAKEVGQALALSTNAVAVVFEALRAATSRSRSEGSPLQFTVEVEPNGAPRIVETPVEALLESAVDEEDAAAVEGALAAARTRGRDRVASILAQPDMLSAEAFAQHLNTSRETINTRRKTNQVLGLQGATRGFRYPAWQIGEDGRPFAALPEIFGALGDSPWAVYRFLIQKHGEIDGMTGLEALRSGRASEAIAAAESVARAFA
ncbi:MAG: XRE family transcriptional regulator [Lysobacteraceae bacterium]|jgi:hypothetical protein|nr:MAG: XRE family transcriptional regulator [Xanthomonadaceae bacterium]